MVAGGTATEHVGMCIRYALCCACACAKSGAKSRQYNTVCICVYEGGGGIYTGEQPGGVRACVPRWGVEEYTTGHAGYAGAGKGGERLGSCACGVVCGREGCVCVCVCDVTCRG